MEGAKDQVLPPMVVVNYSVHALLRMGSTVGTDVKFSRMRATSITRDSTQEEDLLLEDSSSSSFPDGKTMSLNRTHRSSDMVSDAQNARKMFRCFACVFSGHQRMAS